MFPGGHWARWSDIQRNPAWREGIDPEDRRTMVACRDCGHVEYAAYGIALRMRLLKDGDS